MDRWQGWRSPICASSLSSSFYSSSGSCPIKMPICTSELSETVQLNGASLSPHQKAKLWLAEHFSRHIAATMARAMYEEIKRDYILEVSLFFHYPLLACTSSSPPS